MYFPLLSQLFRTAFVIFSTSIFFTIPNRNTAFVFFYLGFGVGWSGWGGPSPAVADGGAVEAVAETDYG
jgi:hypothetical protein